MSLFQSRADQQNYPFILLGQGYIRDAQTLLTDAARTVILADKTIMAQVAATRKWVPWTSVTATDGSAIPMGILMAPGGVAAADLAAGDVLNARILVADALFDSSQIVFDRGSTGVGTALALTTVFTGNAAGSGTATPYFILTAEALLTMRGLIPNTTVDVDVLEN